MIRINQELIEAVSAKAQASARLRMNHNFHQTPEDTLNRMLNAMEPDLRAAP